MKEWTIFLPLGIVLAVAASALTSVLTSERSQATAGSSTELEQTIGRLGESLGAIERRQAELEVALDELARETPGSTGMRRQLGALDDAVAKWMEANALSVATDGDVIVAKAHGELDDDLQESIDALLSGDLTSEEASALWQKLRDEGRLDEVIAHLEGLVELDPNNPDMHFDLGNAYVQKIFDVGPGPMAGVWGQKADDAFDSALALDSTHWESRFMKAVSLSNWPAFMGKAGEAIRNFEILVEQQEARPGEPRFAHTYYFLGNMYQQTGEADKALAAWQRGLELFPDDERLLGQLNQGGDSR